MALPPIGPPNVDPLRLRILKALTTSLLQITPANGYRLDLGPNNKFKRGKVFRGRLRYGPNDPLPMLSIIEAPIPLDPALTRGENVKSTGAWELLIQGFVDDDFENPTDPGHDFMAQVKHRLVYEKQRDRGHGILGGNLGISEMLIGQGAVRPPEDTTEKAFFWLTLTIRFAENLDKPYG